jgi:CRP/FNR family transcriptional regulator, polysaccharide utilization system transcription regulator
MKKILLIEDNDDMRENIEEILELANYEVSTAENGKVGVDKARNSSPDLIICDIMMPELDGYGVLYLISSDPQTSSIPFIFLTAKADKSDQRKGMNLGADDYLTKPFEEMELLSAIESRLSRSEKFKSDFDSSASGFAGFMDEAKAMSELTKLSENRKSTVYKKKDTVFYEGDYPNAVFFINKGKIRTFKMNNDAKEYSTGLYGEGDFIGYMAILEGGDHEESAETLEATEILKIPKEDFLDLLHKNRDVAARFIKILAKNVVDKEQQLLNLAYDSVRKRVADALVALHEKYQVDEEKKFNIAISRSDLASMVGTSPETVIRTLSEFKDEGLITSSGTAINIEEIEILKNLRIY